MNDDEFRKWLAETVQTFGTQGKAAKHFGISSAYLGEIIKGTREPGIKLLDAVGFKRVVCYMRKEEAE